MIKAISDIQNNINKHIILLFIYKIKKLVNFFEVITSRQVTIDNSFANIVINTIKDNTIIDTLSSITKILLSLRPVEPKPPEPRFVFPSKTGSETFSKTASNFFINTT